MQTLKKRPPGLTSLAKRSGFWGQNLRKFHPKPSQSDLGRFISSDPIGFAGGLNAYIYGNQNPVNFVDPSGLKPGSDICEKIRKALINTRREIAQKRIPALNKNGGKGGCGAQPYDKPGAALEETVMGHLLLLDQAYQHYARQIAAWFQNDCGPELPPGTLAPVPELRPTFDPNDRTVPNGIYLPQPFWDANGLKPVLTTRDGYQSPSYLGDWVLPVILMVWPLPGPAKVTTPIRILKLAI